MPKKPLLSISRNKVSYAETKILQYWLYLYFSTSSGISSTENLRSYRLKNVLAVKCF